MFVIGDVHGKYLLLLKLLEEAGNPSEVIFVGDLIDRGHKSREVIDFVIKNDYSCVIGNHEELMLNSLRIVNNEIIVNEKWFDTWMYNGGILTLHNYLTGKNKYDIDALKRHLEVLKKFPVMYWIDNHTVITHNRFLPFVGKYYCTKEEIHELLWNEEYEHTTTGILNIHGHHITEDFPIKPKDGYLNLNTLTFTGEGILTGYDTETKQIISVTEKE